MTRHPRPERGHLERFLHQRALAPAAQRLEALGEQWAQDLHGDWTTILNEGPMPSAGPSWPFRWRVVAALLEAAAGQGPAVADGGALPFTLRAFLELAIPAALHPQARAAPDPRRAAQVLHAAELLATEVLPASGQRRGQAAAPEVPLAPAAVIDPADLLRAALRPSEQPVDLPGVDALRAALARGPLPLAEARALASGAGVLLGTLLDALDRDSLRKTGRPAVRVEAEHIHPTADGVDTGRPPADARGRDPGGPGGPAEPAGGGGPP